LGSGTLFNIKLKDEKIWMFRARSIADANKWRDHLLSLSAVNENEINNYNSTAAIQLTSTLSMVSNPLSISSEFIRDSSIKDIDASDRGFGSSHFEANSI